MELIGILIIILGFALKLDTIAVVVSAGVVTGLVADMSISEIAFAVGFKDSGYFSKCFRKKYDQTPREYMNEWRKG